MYSKAIVIQNATGLHARPASEFVGCAGKFKSKVTIKRAGAEGDGVNAKSVIMLLSQGLSKGTEVVISASGEDETEAVDTLVALIESRFGE